MDQIERNAIPERISNWFQSSLDKNRFTWREYGCPTSQSCYQL